MINQISQIFLDPMKPKAAANLSSYMHCTGLTDILHLNHAHTLNSLIYMSSRKLQNCKHIVTANKINNGTRLTDQDTLLSSGTFPFQPLIHYISKVKFVYFREKKLNHRLSVTSWAKNPPESYLYL